MSARYPGPIARLHIDPVHGLSEEEARRWVDAAALDDQARDQAATVLAAL